MDAREIQNRIGTIPGLKYGVAGLLAALALGLRLLIGDALSGAPFITFFPAILIAAWLGGQRAGLACAALSVILAWAFFIAPLHAARLAWPNIWLSLFYLGVAVAIVLLVARLSRSNAQLRASEAARDALLKELQARVASTADQLRVETRERTQAEEKLAQYERLEAVGQLVGGISHDFNNLLGVVIGNLDIAQRKLQRGNGDIAKHVEAAFDGARRGATLTQRLLAFARRQPLQPAVTDVNALVAGMTDLLTRTLGERVILRCQLADSPWPVDVDPVQLESAIVNLAVNARDAMPDGGTLTIVTRNAHLSGDLPPGAVAGDHAAISVTDTGVGMTPEVMQRAFEPFFTTKAEKGTGLGLSQIHGFVRQSGGHADLHSMPGRGTTVTLYLPRCHAQKAEAAPATDEMPAARGETILVVEDEAGVRDMAVQMLTELGYEVLEAGGGEAALRLLSDGARPDLLLSDVVMPGLMGPELAAKAVALRPGLKVLYMTGYARNAIPDDAAAALMKPFTHDQLARRLREVLG